MKVIKKLADMIDEELDGACHYVKCALKYQEDYPGLSKTLYDLSVDEMGHVSKLHGEVVKIIEAYRREQGEPPEVMMAVYEYVHEKQIEKANQVRMYQDQYKSY